MKKSPSILIVDPQVEGHHLTWIGYITRVFFKHNFQVTLLSDFREKSQELVKNAVNDITNEIRIVSAFNENGQYVGGNCFNSILKVMEKYSIDDVFMNELDLVASNCLRKAAIGCYPPPKLKGILSGVYFRPRFLSETHFSFSNKIKSVGFKKLCQNQYFKHIFLMDEQQVARANLNFNKVGFHLLPDPWDGDYSFKQRDAQEALKLPKNRFILLQFGIGTRRKGLHLVVEAMKNMPENTPVFLLCAGKLSIDSELRSQLEELEKQNKAKILDRYVSQEEEKFCFCATDSVLLPYVEHFGSSAVLSRAAASGKPVIASDYGLTGWRVCNYELGLSFKSNDAESLRIAIDQMLNMNEKDRNVFHHHALDYAQTCSLDSFEKSLISPFNQKNE
ncbi:glycosyltransferase family 1 [Candidatus Magnetomorum sp. HK-1]|nr:glycosyltransferase family 1 [Candidatus Magnetomorum sp. HK-1]